MVERRSQYYTQNIINNLPAGLDRAVLRVLSFRRGAASAIKKNELLADLAHVGYSGADERQVRRVISDLRKAGHLIGSSAGKDPGYYMIDSWEEMDIFLAEEIDARIKDLAESRSALLKAAASQFGERPTAGQERLL